MIVVEGPDGAGKTTLINELATQFDLPIEPKIVDSSMRTLASKKAWCESNVSQGFQPRLFDRHCLISEPIYNSITRSSFDPGFDDLQWYSAMMTMFYRGCKPVIIYCLPSLETIQSNIVDDPDQPRRVKDGIRKIYAQYVAKAAADVPLAGALAYDYTKAVPGVLQRTIELSIERMFHELNPRPRW